MRVDLHTPETKREGFRSICTIVEQRKIRRAILSFHPTVNVPMLFQKPDRLPPLHDPPGLGGIGSATSGIEPDLFTEGDFGSILAGSALRTLPVFCVLNV